MKEIDLNKKYVETTLQQKTIDEAFIEKYLGLIRSVCGKLMHSGAVPKWIEFEDLVSWGIEGLIKAKNNFKSNLDTQFQTYAYYRIKGEIIDCVRKEWAQKNPKDYSAKHKQERQMLSEIVDMSVSSSKKPLEQRAYDALEAASFMHFMSGEVKQAIADKKGMKDPQIELVEDTHEEIWEEINSLEDDERQVVELFYINGLKQIEIANHLKISPSKVSRIHVSLIEKLKTKFNNKGSFL